MWDMLNDNIRDFSAIRAAAGTYRSFKFVSRIVPITSNQSLADFQKRIGRCDKLSGFLALGSAELSQ